MMEEVIEDSNGESSFEFVGGAIKDCASDVSSSARTQTTPFQSVSSDSHNDTLTKLADSTSNLKIDSNPSLPLNVPPPAALPVFDLNPSSTMPITEPLAEVPPMAPSGQIQSYFSSSSNASFPISDVSSRDKVLPMIPSSSARPIMSAVTQPKPVGHPPVVKPPLSTLPCLSSPASGIQSPNISSTLPPPPPPPPKQQSSVVTPKMAPPPMAPLGTPSVMPWKFMTPATLNPPPLSSSSSFNQPPPTAYYQPQMTEFSPAAPNILSPQSYQANPAATSFDISGMHVSPSNSHQESFAVSDSSGGLFSWIKDSVKGNEILNKFAEKAKSSVDSVIYTLDPQMKDFMNASEEINIVVASDKEVKVGPVRQSFQSVFVQATVGGVASHANIAEQPVGYTSALKGAEERISNLRQRGIVHPHQPVVAIENFLLEATPDNWLDIGCLLLQDPKRGLTLKTFTQATPVPTHFVHQAQDCTPNDYPLRWSGFAMSIGQIIGSAMNVPHTEWHNALVGVSRQEMLLLAAKVLAGQYKAQINVTSIHQSMTL